MDLNLPDDPRVPSPPKHDAELQVTVLRRDVLVGPEEEARRCEGDGCQIKGRRGGG